MARAEGFYVFGDLAAVWRFADGGGILETERIRAVAGAGVDRVHGRQSVFVRRFRAGQRLSHCKLCSAGRRAPGCFVCLSARLVEVIPGGRSARRMKGLLIAAYFTMLTLGFSSSCAYAQDTLPPGTASLKFQRGVELAPSAAQQYFLVDGTMWEHARPDLGDVRLYSGGAEVPYVLQTEAGATVREQVDCKVLQPV